MIYGIVGIFFYIALIFFFYHLIYGWLRDMGVCQYISDRKFWSGVLAIIWPLGALCVWASRIGYYLKN